MSRDRFGHLNTNTLADDIKLNKKIRINFTRNQKQDHTEKLDAAAEAFDYQACRDQYWNPEEFSLLWGTPIWDQASPSQRVLLNQLYWVAYYSQIISAEIATIYFNQTSAAGLFAQEDFRQVCDMLDLESQQERAHISAFRTIADQVEAELFQERLFTYPMRHPFAETMVHQDTNWFKRRWKALQLKAFGLLSSGNTFLACQYFTVRGLRTLNGKLVQHRLSKFHSDSPEDSPIPSKVSYYHFQDESYHFHSSTLLSHEVVRCLPPPTAFESLVANLGIRGCQIDHSHFSVVLNGIFWFDPATYEKVFRLLTHPHFGLEAEEALALMRASFGEENEGVHASFETHQTALEHYRKYLEKVDYAWEQNRNMDQMAKASIPGYLATQRQALDRFQPPRRTP